MNISMNRSGISFSTGGWFLVKKMIMSQPWVGCPAVMSFHWSVLERSGDTYLELFCWNPSPCHSKAGKWLQSFVASSYLGWFSAEVWQIPSWADPPQLHISKNHIRKSIIGSTSKSPITSPELASAPSQKKKTNASTWLWSNTYTYHF